jgi:hypothetical protein
VLEEGGDGELKLMETEVGSDGGAVERSEVGAVARMIVSA